MQWIKNQKVPHVFQISEKMAFAMKNYATVGLSKSSKFIRLWVEKTFQGIQLKGAFVYEYFECLQDISEFSQNDYVLWLPFCFNIKTIKLEATRYVLYLCTTIIPFCLPQSWVHLQNFPIKDL